MPGIRQRTKNLIFAGLVGVLATAILSLGIGIYTYSNWTKEKAKIRAEYEEKLEEANLIKQEQQKQRKKVLLAKEEIQAGEKLSIDQFIPVDLPVDSIPETGLVSADELIGKITKINISKQSMVTSSMLFEDGVTPDDLRRAEYTEIMLPTKLKKNDYVDIRINFPTGQDYIVVGKKRVSDLANGTVWFDINEQEILSMSSAIIDGYLNDAKIYALTYVDPFMQSPPIVNYPVNSKVMDLMLKDPNLIRDAKTELSKAARIGLDHDLNSVSAEEKQIMSSARTTIIKHRQETPVAQSPNETGQNENWSSYSDQPNTIDYSSTSTPNTSSINENDNTSITPSVSESAANPKELDIYSEAVDGVVKP